MRERLSQQEDVSANLDALKQSVQILQESENALKAENGRIRADLEKRNKDAEQARVYKGECDRLTQQVMDL